MMIHDMLEAIKLFIILNPMECLVTGIIVFTWTGSYLESVFKFWDWGPQCNKCNEWVFWTDTKIHCLKCDDHRSNNIWEEGYAYGERETGSLR